MSPLLFVLRLHKYTLLIRTHVWRPRISSRFLPVLHPCMFAVHPVLRTGFQPVVPANGWFPELNNFTMRSEHIIGRRFK